MVRGGCAAMDITLALMLSVGTNTLTQLVLSLALPPPLQPPDSVRRWSSG